MSETAAETSTGNDFRKRRLRFDLFLVLTWVASAATVITLVWIVCSILQAALPAVAATGFGFFYEFGLEPQPEYLRGFPVLEWDGGKFWVCFTFGATPRRCHRHLSE
jgi:ABC-type phosphate transport system permease subunit